MTRDRMLSLIITMMYALSHTHVTHLFFLSSFQELSLVFWSLLTLILWQQNDKKKQFLSCLTWIAALSSKETAVILPVLAWLTDLSDLNLVAPSHHHNQSYLVWFKKNVNQIIKMTLRKKNITC